MKTVSNFKMMNLFNDMLNLNLNEKAKLGENTFSGDNADIAITDRDESLETRLSERNLNFLKKVEAAKAKLESGSYGECEDCGCNISEKRLMARPTASFCIGCQEAKETMERHNVNHRRDLGNKFKNDEESFTPDTLVMKNNLNSMNDIKFDSVVDL